jgi:hypothetical protein
MANTKSLKPITAADIQCIFDDTCVDTLAAIGRLPAGAGRKCFAEGVREAARIYARDARMPTDNELHAEIATLYRAAEGKRCGDVAALLQKLSQKATQLLSKRATRLSVELPASADLRDPLQQQKACEAVLRLCQFGGKYVEGRRRRPSGKWSRTWRPLLVAAEPRRHVPKRDAELNFIMCLQLAWLEATGDRPSLAANPKRPSPFTRMVRKSLELIGAGHADAVGLTNKLNKRRRIKKRPVRHQN